MTDTVTPGRICYLQIPAADVARSAEFYAGVFGWHLRRRGDGTIAFDDPASGVSGTWVTGRPPSQTPGVLVYVMVDDVAATLDAVLAHGGEIAAPRTGEAPEFVAWFRDPGGNVFGVGQE